MKEVINNPHFYNNQDVEGTFEDLMKYAVGGVKHPKKVHKMHLWLPSTATQAQVELVKKMIGDDTGRDCTNTGEIMQ